VLSEGQRSTLQTLARSQTTPVRQVRRARALLLAADGMANDSIAHQVGASPTTVRAWRKDLAERGLTRFGMVGGRGRKPTISDETVEAIVDKTRNCKPRGATHWSCRSMAREFGVSPATVQRIWSARGLKPHLVEPFKLSNDPQFEGKLVDVLGLYLNPPENAVVLCVDEKSQVQVLDRTQPSLPMKPHKHPDVQRWLARNRRFHLHFTPPSSSWLNLVERWFRKLTDKALRRGSFNSVPDLIGSIEEYLDADNDDPKPFGWTATAESILKKVRRGRVALQTISGQ